MADLRDALAEISSIRGHMARCTEFRGYGPTTLAATGVLALLVASLQGAFGAGGSHQVVLYLALWIATAVVALTLIGIETIQRARRIHCALATEMLHSAVEQFLPAIVAGGLLTLVLARCAPQSLWMLPGLWQLLFSLGAFASCRFLPKPTFWIGVWYLVTGLGCLALGPGEWAFSPWEMGVPFGVGHLLLAAVLQFGYRGEDDAL